MRVLLVEDEEDLARQLQESLVDAGYAVDVAHDGEEGHYLGEQEPYDAIVLDLGLPVMDGITVLERWRRDGLATPVLILTARAIAGARRSLASMRGRMIMSPSPSIWRKSWRGFAPWCGGRRAMRPLK